MLVAFGSVGIVGVCYARMTVDAGFLVVGQSTVKTLRLGGLDNREHALGLVAVATLLGVVGL